MQELDPGLLERVIEDRFSGCLFNSDNTLMDRDMDKRPSRKKLPQKKDVLTVKTKPTHKE